VEVTQAAIALNEQSFEQERARYGAGLSAYRQVLEAQRDLDKARRSHLQALIDQRRAVVQLARVDGSILERNGFTWAEADALLAAPRPDQHPVVGETISQEQTHL
jgi:biotin carboxylase